MAKVWMTLLTLGQMLASPGWAQSAGAEPSAQAAFRAVLLKYDQRADAETDIGRLRTLAPSVPPSSPRSWARGSPSPAGTSS